MQKSRGRGARTYFIIDKRVGVRSKGDCTRKLNLAAHAVCHQGNIKKLAVMMNILIKSFVSGWKFLMRRLI